MALEDAGYPFVGGRVCHTALRKVAAEMPAASRAAASFATGAINEGVSQ